MAAGGNETKNKEKIPANEKFDDWELLLVPPLVQHSGKLMDDVSSNLNMDENKKGDILCGYLTKLGVKGIIKSWKRRWFVYDHRRCLLHYYHKPQDVEALGNINIANASFNVRADDKAMFEISSEGRTYQLQAPDRNTMLFWLQELQARRREFGKPNSSSDTTTGLIAEIKKDELNKKENGSVDGVKKRIQQPLTIGENSADFLDNRNSWNFSFTNLNTEFKNWRKGIFTPITGEPLHVDGLNPPHKVDFGFSQLVSIINKDSASLKRSSLLIDDEPGNGQSTLYNVKSCPHCEETESMISVLQEAISIAQIEIHTRDEVIKSLSEQLKFVTDSNVVKSTEEELFEEREQYIFQLTRMVKKFQNEIDELKIEAREKDLRIEEFTEKEIILKEMINAKDNSIVDLTNQIDIIEKNIGEATEDIEVKRIISNITPNSKDLDYNQLKDTCDAVKAQNDFLNQEILEMTDISQSNAEGLKSTSAKLERQEAEFLKLKSRYLFLLNEFSSPKRGDGNEDIVSPDIIERLIDDAIDEKDDLTEITTNLKDKIADKYGFFDLFDKELSPVQVKDENITFFPENDNEHMPLEVSVKVKWENYLVSLGSTPITRTEELKLLVRQGIPHQYRAQVWKDLLFLRINNERNKVGPGYYNQLLKENEGVYSPSLKQIELDLLRTLPNNKYYEKIDSEGTAKLRRVLLAYNWHNPTVGYCQGLNRLGAIILLYLDEETAFWGVVAMIEYLMPMDYFSRTLIGAQVDQRVLRELLELKCPRLSTHLQSINLDLSLISFNWFLTIFVDFFPIELMLRVWDTFFSEGSKVLFRYALAIFKLFEEDLMKFDNPGPVFDFFRKFPKSKFDLQKVIHVAFVQLNPFSMKLIESKRRYYRPILQAQVDEFEVMRQSYRKRRENSEVFLSDDDN